VSVDVPEISWTRKRVSLGRLSGEPVYVPWISAEQNYAPRHVIEWSPGVRLALGGWGKGRRRWQVKEAREHEARRSEKALLGQSWHYLPVLLLVLFLYCS
jgi:hypothetical protein